jgi:hypothetical protein
VKIDSNPLKRLVMTTNRRTFLLTAVASSSAFGAAQALAQERLDEKNPQAAALGYRTDTTKVDAKAFPKHAASQQCNGCGLWQSKPTDAWGNCPLFAGKQVAAKGWCSAWVKKG